MKIVLIGEAADHETELRAGLDAPHPIVALDAAAATDRGRDEVIETDDVVVSLRWRRPAGTGPRFALLHVPGAGTDGIDLDALHPGTTVANVSEHEIPIAEFVLARLLEWEIRAAALQSAFGAATWTEQYRHRVPHGELHGHTLGIVGYGRIGRAIAGRAAAFGLRVQAVDDHSPSDAVTTVAPVAGLDDLLATSDYVVIACPLTDDTRGLVDATALRRMPAHAVLVNISRAEIVDEAALYAALASRTIGGAILDVWYRYPTTEDAVAPASHPFWDLPNTWCTPHSSAWTRELPRRRYRVIAENINRFVAGEALQNVVRRAATTSSSPL